MNSKRTYFPETTGQQRKLLFETWEATDNVTQACRTAHVERGTFYYWKPRFDKDGYAGLEAFAIRGPKNPHRTPPETEQKVVDLKQAQPNWGMKRIADELAKANSWGPLVSPHTGRRILKDAGLWESVEVGAKKKAHEDKRSHG